MLKVGALQEIWAYEEPMKYGNTYNERNIFPHAMGGI